MTAETGLMFVYLPVRSNNIQKNKEDLLREGTKENVFSGVVCEVSETGLLPAERRDHVGTKYY